MHHDSTYYDMPHIFSHSIYFIIFYRTEVFDKYYFPAKWEANEMEALIGFLKLEDPYLKKASVVGGIRGGSLRGSGNRRGSITSSITSSITYPAEKKEMNRKFSRINGEFAKFVKILGHMLSFLIRENSISSVDIKSEKIIANVDPI